MRLIDADALHKRIKAKNTSNAMMRAMKAECLAEIDDAPTIEERKKGKWIYGEDNSGQDGWFCSECGFFIPWYYSYYGLNNIDFIRDFHTCPSCDAKMLTYTGKEEGDTP